MRTLLIPRVASKPSCTAAQGGSPNPDACQRRAEGQFPNSCTLKHKAKGWFQRRNVKQQHAPPGDAPTRTSEPLLRSPRYLIGERCGTQPAALPGLRTPKVPLTAREQLRKAG